MKAGRYALPRELEPDLARVLAYWEGLKRGDAEMPFYDDASLSALPGLSERLMLLEVFDQPLRFRFGAVGAELAERYCGDLSSKFLDEIGTRHPLQYLNSQCRATVEKRAPTYRHYTVKPRVRLAEDYSRLLLPMWGDGHIGMLLGVVAWG